MGFSPTMPHSDAGLRTDPAASVPTDAMHMPAATATADPLLEPPGIRLRSQGLQGVP